MRNEMPTKYLLGSKANPIANYSKQFLGIYKNQNWKFFLATQTDDLFEVLHCIGLDWIGLLVLSCLCSIVLGCMFG